jgi:hypothetical protein
MNRCYAKEVQMTNKYMKKCSTSYSEKNANPHYVKILTPVRMAVIKKQASGCEAGDRGRNTYTLLVGM